MWVKFVDFFGRMFRWYLSGKYGWLNTMSFAVLSRIPHGYGCHGFIHIWICDTMEQIVCNFWIRNWFWVMECSFVVVASTWTFLKHCQGCWSMFKKKMWWLSKKKWWRIGVHLRKWTESDVVKGRLRTIFTWWWWTTKRVFRTWSGNIFKTAHGKCQGKARQKRKGVNVGLWRINGKRGRLWNGLAWLGVCPSGHPLTISHTGQSVKNEASMSAKKVNKWETTCVKE